jgi:hypothetical protein
MTLSPAERRAAIDRVLTLIAERWGDADLLFHLGARTIAAARPMRTTLEELKDKGYIKRAVSGDDEPYELTPEGWFEAQKVSGRFASAEFDERRARLFSAMKRLVDGRDREVLVGWRELAEARLPRIRISTFGSSPRFSTAGCRETRPTSHSSATGAEEPARALDSRVHAVTPRLAKVRQKLPPACKRLASTMGRDTDGAERGNCRSDL